MPEKKSVTEWLNDVDYTDDVHYVPTEFAIHFVNFIKLVNGVEGEENESPVLHYRMLDQIAGSKKDIVNMVYRGAAKTTVLGEYLFLYLAVYGDIPGFGDVPLAIYVSDSIENGVKNMRKNLEYRWENSEFLQKYVPYTRFTDVRWEFHSAACGCKICSPSNPTESSVFIVKGYGAKTGVRGTKEMGQRPYLAVLDDLVSDEDAKSATVIASIEDTVYKAIDYALHTKRKKTIWSGTPFNSRDPLYMAVESGAWHVNVYPVCNEFPCTREEFVGSWPDRFDYDYVEGQYLKAKRQGKIFTFNQEMMLRIMSDEDRLVDDDEIKWYDRKTLLEQKDAYNYYITTDFATSEKSSSDFSVISVWAVNNAGHWFWVDGICVRQLMDKNIDDLFRLVQKWKPQEVGVEISGQQKGFIQWIEREMMHKNIYFTLAKEKDATKPGIRPATDKMVRFNVVLPWFKQGKFHFPEDMENHPWIKEFVTEISLASADGFKSKKDDIIDTISMLGVINFWLPSEETWKDSDDEELDPDFYPESADNFGSYVV